MNLNSDEEMKDEEGNSDIEIYSDTERDKSLEEKFKIVEHSPDGRFERFNDEIGLGVRRTIYRAYDGDSGCEVAWNVIKLRFFQENEVSLLKKIRHKHIIEYLDTWTNYEKEEVVFITEIVSGGSLKNYLKKIKSPRLKIIKSWCRDILKGIEYLHTLDPPVVHRDIKCDNILIHTNNNEIRLGDLGLTAIDSQSHCYNTGTLEFMAPEIFDEEYGPAGDIYAFGMTVMEMITNQTPYRECMTQAQVYKKIMSGENPLVLNMIIDEEIKEFINICLKPSKERPSVQDLLKHPFLTNANEKLDNSPVALLPSIGQFSRILEKKSSTMSNSTSHDNISVSRITDSNEKSCFSEAKERNACELTKFDASNIEEPCDSLKNHEILHWNEDTDHEKSDLRKDLEISKRNSDLSRLPQITVESGDKRWEEDFHSEITCIGHKDSIFSFKNEIENAFKMEIQRNQIDSLKSEQLDYTVKIIDKTDKGPDESIFTVLLASNNLETRLIFNISKSLFNNLKKIRKVVQSKIKEDDIKFVKNKNELIGFLASMIQSNMESLLTNSPMPQDKLGSSEDTHTSFNNCTVLDFSEERCLLEIDLYYRKYLESTYNKEYLENETEEQLILRQKLEKQVVEDIHKMQKKNLEKRKLNSSTEKAEKSEESKAEEIKVSKTPQEEKSNAEKDLMTNSMHKREEIGLCTKNSSVSTSDRVFSSIVFSTQNSRACSVDASPHFKPSTADSSYCEPQNPITINCKNDNLTKEAILLNGEVGNQTPIWPKLVSNNIDVKFSEGPKMDNNNNTPAEDPENFKLESLDGSQNDFKKLPETRKREFSLGLSPYDILKNESTPMRNRENRVDHQNEIKSDYCYSSSTSPKKCLITSVSGNDLIFFDKTSSPVLQAQKKKRPNSPGFFDKLRNHVFKGPLERSTKNIDENEVKLLQIALNEVIIDEEVETNGRYGFYTEKLVKKFQEKAGLPVNGIVTEEVWDSLKERIISSKTKLGTKNSDSSDGEKKVREELNRTIRRKKQNEASSLALSNLEIKIFQEL